MPIDRGEHEAHGDQRTKAEHCENERQCPVTCTPESQRVRPSAHDLCKMLREARAIKQVFYAEPRAFTPHDGIAHGHTTCFC